MTYDYALQDIAPWAQAPSLQNAFPRIKATLVRPSHSETDGMVLTDRGWQDERAVR